MNRLIWYVCCFVKIWIIFWVSSFGWTFLKLSTSVNYSLFFLGGEGGPISEKFTAASGRDAKDIWLPTVFIHNQFLGESFSFLAYWQLTHLGPHLPAPLCTAGPHPPHRTHKENGESYSMSHNFCTSPQNSSKFCVYADWKQTSHHLWTGDSDCINKTVNSGTDLVVTLSVTTKIGSWKS